MNHILILTDFSDHAAHAADYACNLAQKWGVRKVSLLNTYEIIPLYDTGEAALLALSMQQTEELEKIRQDELDKLIEYLRPKLPSAVEIESYLVNNNLTDAVNEVCEAENVDLVVMGIKVKDELEQFVSGSHAQKAIENAQYPVLIVPMQTPLEAPQKIVLATDFSESKDPAILNTLHKMLDLLEVPLLAVHKFRADEDPRTASSKAEILKQEMREHACEVRFLNVEDSLSDSINQIAMSEGAGLLISVHRKRGFWATLLHKSTTKKLAWQSRLPVLVLQVG
ncbi:MAG: universal stress protein [Niabella sp.]